MCDSLWISILKRLSLGWLTTLIWGIINCDRFHQRPFWWKKNIYTSVVVLPDEKWFVITFSGLYCTPYLHPHNKCTQLCMEQVVIGNSIILRTWKWRFSFFFSFRLLSLFISRNDIKSVFIVLMLSELQVQCTCHLWPPNVYILEHAFIFTILCFRYFRKYWSICEKVCK